MKSGKIYQKKTLCLTVFFFLISAAFVQMGTATIVPKKTVTATAEFLGGGFGRPTQSRLTMQQIQEIEALVTDLTQNLQETRSQAEARQLFNVFLNRLSTFHLFPPYLHMNRFVEKASLERNGDVQRLNPFNNRYCFLITYINGSIQDWNIFVLAGVVKLLMQGDPVGALWLSYGNLKPLHLGQWYTQFSANYSKNERGVLCSLGLFGLKIGNISKADPMVTMERFTGLKITFKIMEDQQDHYLMSKKCLYIGFARSVYEGDIPE